MLECKCAGGGRWELTLFTLHILNKHPHTLAHGCVPWDGPLATHTNGGGPVVAGGRVDRGVAVLVDPGLPPDCLLLRPSPSPPTPRNNKFADIILF